MALSREQFLGANHFETKDIDVEKIGIVKIKELSVEQVRRFQDLVTAAQAASDPLAFFDTMISIIILCTVDDNMKPLFQESDATHLTSVLTKQQMLTIGNSILELSKLTGADAAESAIEEVEKNSESNPTSSSAIA